MAKKIKVGISVGDLNGIGLEVVLKTLSDKRILDFCSPIIYGAPKVIGFYKKMIGLSDLNFNIINDVDDVMVSSLNLITCWNEEIKLNPGNADKTLGKYAVISIQKAVEDLASNKIDVLVTAPINKHTIQSDEFNFPGHTEFLANYANEENYIMMMISETLKVAVVTGHVPVKEVEGKITKELIVNKLEVMAKSLKRDFGIELPKIAVLGLNPHAGDEGTIGSFDKDIIVPAIKETFSNKSFKAFGPFGADGFFGSKAYQRYDAVLAMYHDQGLVPFKTICFDDGVNFTAGLPIVRTSPDHGVGYDLVGKNIASEQSFRSALYWACDIYRVRNGNKKLEQNRLDAKPGRPTEILDEVDN